MLLHTVNKSPGSNPSLASCLRAAAAGSTLLLIEDGVYAAVRDTEGAAAIAGHEGLTCYALSSDLAARGLLDLLDPSITAIDYADFVRLTTECHAVQSWY